MTKNTTISARELFANSCHIGHKTSKWNPKMLKYIYGVKGGVHILDLAQSAKMFAESLNQIQKLISEKRTILFVSTKPQTVELLENIKQTTGMPIVCHKWLGGLLTNFSTIKQRVALLRKIKERFETGEIEKYTKKERSEFKKEMEKLDISIGGIEKMNSLPDAIFVIDGKRDQIALTEAKKLGIPVIGLMDSNVDPDSYDYGFPCNDDSAKSLAYTLGIVEELILNSQKSSAKEAPQTSEAGGVRKIKK